jgi:hypothetical protein
MHKQDAYGRSQGLSGRKARPEKAGLFFAWTKISVNFSQKTCQAAEFFEHGVSLG